MSRRLFGSQSVQSHVSYEVLLVPKSATYFTGRADTVKVTEGFFLFSFERRVKRGKFFLG